MTQRNTRRDFLKQASSAGLGFWAAGGVSLADSKSPNEKLNFACIGVGGKGSSDTDHVGQLGNIVALCDCDENHLENKAKKFPDAKKYSDFRKMFDELGGKIDAVTVSTPDHTHAPASIMAMRLGKHVYCQKPLTHSVYEARMMREIAREKKVCTQMGNQGTADNGLRTAVEIVQSGALGKVTEVHVWTNRPIWPQGTDALFNIPQVREAALAAVRNRPLPKIEFSPPPKHVNWDAFLGPAPDRPYAPGIHPFAWRGWWDFGTGALGDMACHTANMAFMALKLASPTHVKAECGQINPETYPTWARVELQFPPRDELAPLKFFWYEGSRVSGRVLPPKDLLAKVLNPGEEISGSGSMLVGDKGILFSPSDYGASFRLLPHKVFEGYKPPEARLPRNGKGDLGMKQEWVEAIKAGKPEIALSNFNYAALLTETILLGNVAMRVGKKEFDWDAANLKATNCPEADRFIKREYRKGWTL